jgi:hypothetical protein
MPRDTMLMTSVSASTAQMLDLLGLSDSSDSAPISSTAHAEVARDVLEELARARGALAGHLVASTLPRSSTTIARRAARRRRAPRAPGSR